MDMTGHGESAAAGGMDDVTLTAWVDDIGAAVDWVTRQRPTRGGEGDVVTAAAAATPLGPGRVLGGGQAPVQSLAAAAPMRVVLVGYSFGALAAAHFAAHR